MTESPEELAAVEQLLAESDALRGWLARLDQAPGAAPDSVRQRVHHDYQQRLDQLTAGLGAHADVIAAKLGADRAEHADLQARATGAGEALAEAELRHAVGEYDDERFENERRRQSSDIETYQLSLGAVAERIARLEEIQALVQRAPRPFMIDIEPPPTAAIVVPEVHTLTASQSELMAIGDLAPDSDDGLAIFDEPASEQWATNPPNTSVAAEPQLPETGPLSFRPSGGGVDAHRSAAAPPTRARPFESAPPLGIPGADMPPRFVRPGDLLGGRPAPPVTVPTTPTPVPEATPIFGAERVAAGPALEANAMSVGRTLRCGECGAMNRPLEWYCEKCGAELTAV